MQAGMKKIHDAIVVGSGASGGWVAEELTEHGVGVLMLEAGPPRIPTRDFTEHVWTYQLKFRGFGDQRARESGATQNEILRGVRNASTLFVSGPLCRNHGSHSK